MKEKTLSEKGRHVAIPCTWYTLLAAVAIFSATSPAVARNPETPEHKAERPGAVRSETVDVIRGKVTDEKGEGLPGVSIVVKGTQQGTTSDAVGNFSINVPSANSVLVFSFVGYTAQEVPVGSQTSLNIRLLAESRALDEVVVTALGIRRETKSLGYSVTKVDGDNFTKTRETNFANSLTGKVAGVNISPAATGPAGSSRVTIRGNTSISGNNQPLYIINGLPMDNSQLGGPKGDNPDFGDNISSINPDDIEEVTVLKGATAAALYGSRAKNGAILITTKSGKGNKGLGVEFNTNNTFEVPFFLWELQKEYGQGYGGVKPASQQDAANHGQNHWGSRYDGSETIQLDGVKRPYSYVKDQVLEDFYSTGHTNSNNLSFSGGGDKGSFRLGITDMRNKGIIPNATMRRNNISLGLNQAISKNLNLSANVDYVNERVDNRYVFTGTSSNSAGTILYVNSNMPTSALSPGYNEDFKEKVLGTDLNATNPYYTLNRIKNRTDKDRFISTVNVRYNLFDWLFVQAKAGQDYYNFMSSKLVPEGTGYRPNGQLDQIQQNFWERNFEGMIGLNRSLNKDFDLAVNLGGNLMAQHRYTTTIVGSGFVVPQLHVINNTVNRNTTTATYDKKINSVFATAELSYRNYLYLNLTGRNDWFSTLNPESNNFFYPSAGLSFVFSQALELPRAISFGKLRVAYAAVGGDTDPYLLNLTYGLLPYNYDGRSLGTINQFTVPNNRLRPLSVNEFEAGLDLRLFNNRLGFDIAAYNKLTTNDIAVESISSTTGYSGVSVNVGEIRNRGIELLTTVKPVTTQNFSWDLSFNLAYNKSKVLKISNTSKELILATSTKAFIKHIEGEEYSQIVGRTIKRNEQGQDIIDATGLPIVPANVVSFGSGIHKYTTGLINTFTYKTFTLSAQVDGKFGGKIYSETNYSLDHRGMAPHSLLGRESGAVLPGVTESGEVNNVLVTADRVNNRAIIVRRRDALDDYIYDASFIKLRYVSLTYNLPKAVYERIGFVKGASVSLVGRNLQILMKHTPGLDPETNISAGNDQGIESTALPPTRSYGFNVNLKF
ncbi:TonB-linked SusC/RagA family outer membrane protein [Larkinella arboricola]|uniref:TonB-linked SusC/RagA family outer membrane protein n=1 Tax=Larkinella arboricola TaxID=643671 RepID=A0A327WQD1_LARAB|nr:SusC/RagA family TonB-linked outer membrane protein [Larkinella arboricola]RAJ94120.1 TonB-linked SusC/RagA family outer membrane protein [Larkinella arboricola]